MKATIELRVLNALGLHARPAVGVRPVCAKIPGNDHSSCARGARRSRPAVSSRCSWLELDQGTVFTVGSRRPRRRETAAAELSGAAGAISATMRRPISRRPDPPSPLRPARRQRARHKLCRWRNSEPSISRVQRGLPRQSPARHRAGGRRTASRLHDRLDGPHAFARAVDLLLRCLESRGKIVVVGVGKSGHNRRENRRHAHQHGFACRGAQLAERAARRPGRGRRTATPCWP